MTVEAGETRPFCCLRGRVRAGHGPVMDLMPLCVPLVYARGSSGTVCICLLRRTGAKGSSYYADPSKMATDRRRKPAEQDANARQGLGGARLQLRMFLASFGHTGR
jgi:hypothetical protein